MAKYCSFCKGHSNCYLAIHGEESVLSNTRSSGLSHYLRHVRFPSIRFFLWLTDYTLKYEVQIY